LADHITESGAILINLEQVGVYVIIWLHEHGEVREHLLVADLTVGGNTIGGIKRAGTAVGQKALEVGLGQVWKTTGTERPEVAWTLGVTAVGAEIVVVGQATCSTDGDAKWEEWSLSVCSLLSETLVHTVAAMSSHEVVGLHARLEVGMISIVTVLSG